MNILEPKTALERIIGSGIYITFVPVADSSDFITFMSDVDVDIVDEPEIHEDGTVRISPDWVSSKHTVNYGIKDSKGKDTLREIKLADFRNSKQLYDKVTGKKTKFKILHDQASFYRSKELYEPISQIEKDLRSKYLVDTGTEKLTEPKNYRKELPDHKVAQIDLFELVTEHLLGPATDEYYLSKISKGLDPLDARRLTRLDEHKLPFSPDELKYFRDIRNAVMHFRVVTKEDADFIFEARSRMFQHQMMSIAYEIVKSTDKSITIIDP